MLAESALVAEQGCHESAEHATVLATKALTKDEYPNDNYAKANDYANDNYVEAGEYIEDGYNDIDYSEAGKYAKVEYAKDNETSTLTMPPLAPPTAVLSPPHRPTSYVDAVLSTMGGSSQPTSLTLASAALPSPAIDSQLRAVRQCARPCRHVGRHHHPRAPNPQAHILCGRRHWPHAPNKSILNGQA